MSSWPKLPLNADKFCARLANVVADISQGAGGGGDAALSTFRISGKQGIAPVTTYMPPGSPEYERFIRFKRNLLYWEAKRGITRQQLLDHMGVDVKHFDRASKMTREEKIAYLEKMAAFLSIPLSALFAPPPSDYRSAHLDGWRRE